MARRFADNIVYLLPAVAPPRPRVAMAGGASVLAFRSAVRLAAAPVPASAARAPRRALLLALACVLPAALGFGHAVVRQQAQRQVAAAAPRTLALPGGGTAWLDAAAALSYAATGPLAARLERGHAQFAAPANAARPLRVHAGEGVIDTANGRFALTRRDHAVRVEALAGTLTVRLPASGQQVTLRAGQALDYGYGRLGPVRPAP